MPIDDLVALIPMDSLGRWKYRALIERKGDWEVGVSCRACWRPVSTNVENCGPANCQCEDVERDAPEVILSAHGISGIVYAVVQIGQSTVEQTIRTR